MMRMMVNCIRMTNKKKWRQKKSKPFSSPCYCNKKNNGNFKPKVFVKPNIIKTCPRNIPHLKMIELFAEDVQNIQMCTFCLGKSIRTSDTFFPVINSIRYHDGSWFDVKNWTFHFDNKTTAWSDMSKILVFDISTKRVIVNLDTIFAYNYNLRNG